MQFLTIILSLLWCTLGILGNVEKTIFLTPPPISLLPSRLNLDDLHLESLSLSNRSLRRQIPAVFPSTLHPHGTETWLRLEGLKEQQRYEVRICWAATQPTSFSLDIFDLDHVFQTQSLIFSLAGYAEHRQLITETRYDGKNNPNLSAIKKSTTLLLRVLAAADYYSSNATLMQNVPPVNVDIILDPYLFNILPESLLPTVLYITVISIGAWFLADLIWEFVHQFSQASKTPVIQINPSSPSPAKKDI